MRHRPVGFDLHGAADIGHCGFVPVRAGMRRGNLQSKAAGHSQCGRVAGAYVQGSTEPKGVRALCFAEVSNTRLFARSASEIIKGRNSPSLDRAIVAEVSQQPSSNPATLRSVRCCWTCSLSRHRASTILLMMSCWRAMTFSI